MITVSHSAAQGDVMFRRVDRIPEHAHEQPRTTPLVVAHSETGHHHVVEGVEAKLFSTEDSLLGYLQFEGASADVVHLRDRHAHETLRLLGSGTLLTYYEVRRQREHAPEGFRPAGD